MKVSLLSIAVVALIVAGEVSAHHSFAMFDYNKQVSIDGEVKELRWANPHIHIFINVADGKGGVVEWDIEGGTPSNLRKRGWSKDVVKPGERIRVIVRPMKDGSNGGDLVQATRHDGTPIGTTAGR